MIDVDKAIERFHKLYRKLENGCWEWTASKRGEYGQFMYRRRPWSPHRFAAKFILKLEIDGVLVRHKCDNKLCVNPDHLLLGTDKDNAHDRDLRGRSGSRKFTDEEVKEIRVLSSVVLYKYLAKLFDTDRGHISRIVRKEYLEIVPDATPEEVILIKQKYSKYFYEHPSKT